MKRTQFAWVIIIVILAVSGLVLYKTPIQKGMLTVPIILGSLILLFYKLTITVTDEFVQFSFGIGLIYGKYKLTAIVACRPIKYLPLGWGIRLRPGVILYNVSGNKAIELELKNKKRKVWIGTVVPEELAEYINSRLN